MRLGLLSSAALLSLALVGCSRDRAPDPAATPESAVPATPTPLVSAPAQGPSNGGPTKFGAPITATPTVALADIARSPMDFKGKTVVTTGTVASVCQERGCWMEIKDSSGKSNANVRMHGHAFFIPRSSSGKNARVQGTVVLMKDGKECDEMSATGASLELDATGVELL